MHLLKRVLKWEAEVPSQAPLSEASLPESAAAAVGQAEAPTSGSALGVDDAEKAADDSERVPVRLTPRVGGVQIEVADSPEQEKKVEKGDAAASALPMTKLSRDWKEKCDEEFEQAGKVREGVKSKEATKSKEAIKSKQTGKGKEVKKTIWNIREGIGQDKASILRRNANGLSSLS